MGKVISTLTNTTYITIILPQNCPKTTSKLPQNFWICSDPPPLLRTLFCVLKAVYNIKYLTFIIYKSTFLLIHLHCSSTWMKHSIPRINSNVLQGLTLGGPSGFHIFPIQIHQTHIFKIQGQSYNISKITVSIQYLYILMCMMSCQIQIFNCSSFLHNVKIIKKNFFYINGK